MVDPHEGDTIGMTQSDGLEDQRTATSMSRRMHIKALETSRASLWAHTVIFAPPVTQLLREDAPICALRV